MEFMDQLRKGSTTLLILAVLQEHSMYGYQISRELERRSDGYFAMKEGLLYPALHQMEKDGLLTSEWRRVGGRERKYYRVTALGSERLVGMASDWRMFTAQLLKLIGGSL
jgi:PadR family transcriptional regulator, regulatory protein PadR